jgi:hypothetical protein
MNRPLGFFLFLVLATVVGCGSNAPKYANIKGTVTFNGAPIPKGKIMFVVPGQAPTSMDIDDGKFNGQAMVGENRVAVTATKRVGTAQKLSPEAERYVKGYNEKFKHMPGQEGGSDHQEYDPNLVEYIPSEWSFSNSKQTRVVEAGTTNEFEFNIKGPDKH